MNRTIAIIGAGNMGAAFYRRWQQVFGDDCLRVCDEDEEKLKMLGARHISTDANESIKGADFVLLAIKPQSFQSFVQSVQVTLQHCTLLSIMAGVTMHRIFEATGCRKIVRSMPNLAVQVGESYTAWVAAGEISSEEKESIAALWRAVGIEEEFTDESQLDIVTALSGSGPAFYFHLAALFVEKAVSLGFTAQQAQKIAEQTLLGAGKFLQQSPLTPAKARDAVTSKGGTTEAAFRHLQDHQFGVIFQTALDRAIARAKELNN